MRFFNTLRAKLLIVMGILLIATLSVQYYLTVRRDTDSKRFNDRQQQALVAGLTLGVSGITSNDELSQLVDKSRDTLYDRATERRLKDIIIINSNWEVYDCLNPEYQPTKDAEGNTVFRKLS